MSVPIVVLSTDTPHHRYFINRLLQSGIEIKAVIFETTSVVPPFSTAVDYASEQDRFEQRRWKNDLDLAGVEIICIENINDPQLSEQLKSMQPCLGAVFGTRRLGKPLIDIFTMGLINVHRGIAEQYRGIDSELWAIYHKDYENIGVTLHRVDQQLDTGAIVARKRLVLVKDMKVFQLRCYLSEIATSLMIDCIHAFTDGRGEPQLEYGRYYSFMPSELKKIISARFDKYCGGLS